MSANTLTKINWAAKFWEGYKCMGGNEFGGGQEAEPLLRLSIAKPPVSEVSQPSGRAIVEGPQGPEILVYEKSDNLST